MQSDTRKPGENHEQTEAERSGEPIDLYSVRGVMVTMLDQLRWALLAWPDPTAKAKLGNMRAMFCDGLDRLAGGAA